MSEPLFIVPTYVRSQHDFDTTETTIHTFREQHPETPLLLVDDCSPDEELREQLEALKEKYSFGYHQKQVNSGFSSTVNIGLQHALDKDMDAVLCNADLNFQWPVVEEMQNTTDTKNRPAAVVGARLLYPTGMIQHAGVYMSLLHRTFAHRFQFAPHDLPEALLPVSCPVTGALQYIRHETLQVVGLYDEETFSMAFEDVDYCVRVSEAGLECVYNPQVVAYHHESLFRGQGGEKVNEWHRESWPAFVKKHQTTGMGQWIWPLN